MRIAPRSGTAINLDRDRVYAAAAILIVALGAIPEFFSLLQMDKAWYLQAAGMLLDGVRPYVDQFIEMNPPLIMWLNAIPAALARALNVSPDSRVSSHALWSRRSHPWDSARGS